jgi:HPt (histidine-containing phosphotransfer) domain-containing protein
MLGAKKTVDLDHLSRYTGGDAAINAEVLRLFNTQAGELVLRLRTILEARDAKSWKEVTHTIKGAARGIGAFPLADAAAFAEPIDLVKDSGNASQAIKALKTEADEVEAFIKAFLEDASHQTP